MFKLDSPFLQALNKLVDLLLLSVLWTLLSVTVVGIGPATAALYYAVVKSVRRDRGSAVGEFFRCLRENWKLSVPMGLLFGALWTALVLFDLPNVLAIPAKGFSLWRAASVVKICLVCGIAAYLFPLISRYQVRFGGALLTALTLSLRHFPRTLFLLAVLLAAASTLWSAPFLLLILPGMLCVMISHLMEPVLLSILPPQEEDPGVDRWYLE